MPVGLPNAREGSVSPTLHSWGASRLQRLAVASLIVAIAGCERAISPDEAPELSRESAGASLVAAQTRTLPGRFIVTLEPKARAADVAREHGIQPEYVYQNVVNGFAGSIADAARAGLLRDSRVVRLDPDRVLAEADGGVQSPAPWGLDRIDQRSSTLDGRFGYATRGEGVTAYVLDTGIRYSHADFGGRASFGFDAFGGDGSDCRGHGTHVAGTLAGAVHGVAKAARLVSVRVLDCAGSGTTSGVIAGLDWTVSNAARPAVVNLSLSGDADDALDAAIRRTVAAGLTVVVAAGNNARDACTYSPARVPDAITTGATDEADKKPYFSNWGPCIDWYAPGTNIKSAYNSSDTAATTMNGTSMAAPHTAGAAAIYLAAHPSASPAQVATALGEATTKSIVMWQVVIGNLLYAGQGMVDGEPPIVSEPVPPDEVAPLPPSEPVPSEPAPSEPAPPADTIPPVTNLAPNAGFLPACSRLVCSFTDASTDPEGRLTRWEWNFGDGTSVTESSAGAQHRFTASGRYQVTLRVTDDAGLTASAAREIAVGVQLAVSGRKVKGKAHAELVWSGAGTTSAAIMVNGAVVATIPNTGTYTYRASGRGQSTYRFRVCETGTTEAICSAEYQITI
jgi:subtilisin family serine protease